ncbi:hypothetical protein BDR03DRAFT_1018172 [Suillus americanus]|nr:hypothetical protein BDR03DRAFT_1018172 [Suillus americanus]
MTYEGFRKLPVLDYSVIEVNARLSHWSALASKATGYLLAYAAIPSGIPFQNCPTQ